MKKGFTLVEVMIVVSIIGLLAAIIVPILIGNDAKKVAKEQAQELMFVDPVSAKSQEDNTIALCFEYKGIKVYQFRGKDGQLGHFQSCSHCGSREKLKLEKE